MTGKINIEEIYSIFPVILEQRLLYQRKTVDHVLAPFSHAIATAISLSSDSEYMHSILDENIVKILEDCEIYFEMERIKALDTLAELSNYATIYAIYPGSNTYEKICKMIKRITASYPASDVLE